MGKSSVNRLFVTDKPVFRSSNSHLGTIKRKYGIRKAGFSGTLDPFASGCLIVATGQYTKLFRYLKKTPKTYRATLWLGAESPSLDIENISSTGKVPRLKTGKIEEVLKSLRGKLEYMPPKYSAKNIGGRRAYEIMRAGGDVKPGKICSDIYDLRLLHYRHPFVTFEATVSEGTYIRSLGEMMAGMLNIPGTLSSLRRIREGEFSIGNEEPLDPMHYLAPPPNRYLGDPLDLELGRKVQAGSFEKNENGVYVVDGGSFFSIMEFEENGVRYLLNRIEKFHGA
jgi:tRNA pseudouridine55 synthase